MAERTFHVPHIRQTKDSRKELTDPRDIYETVANNASRRVRACILEIVPSDIVNYAVQVCQNTLRSTIKKGPEERAKLLEAFKAYDVTSEDIEAFIQRKFEAIEDSQWLRLREIYNALKDGIAKKEDFFKNTPKTEAPKKAPEPKQEPKPEPMPTAPQNGPEAFEDSGDLYADFDEPEEF